MATKRALSISARWFTALASRSFKRACWTCAIGPMRSSNVHLVDVLAGAKPWAGVRWRATAAVGAKGAPTALRCSDFGRAAKLTSLAALVAFKQLRRVSLRSARVRAPTETLCSSPPHRRASAHPPTAWRGKAVLLGGRSQAGHRARLAPGERACGARQGAGSMPACCQHPLPRTFLSRKAWGWPPPGCVCDGEERSPGVGARTRALRELTRRSCSSATNAVSEASSAARPQGEYRSAPCVAGRRIRSPVAAGPKPCSRTTDKQAHLQTVANSRNEPQANACCMYRGFRAARWSN